MRSSILALVLSALAITTAVGCSASASDDAGVAADQAIVGADRDALLDSLRAPVEEKLNGQKVRFDVTSDGGVLRTDGAFAWLQGSIELRSTGEAPTTKGTVYEDAEKEGLFDGFHVEALLQRRGSGWKVVELGIGSTDVWWAGIDERYPAAPKEIFPWRDVVPGLEHAEPESRQKMMDALRAFHRQGVMFQDIVFNVRDQGGVFRMADEWVWMEGEVEKRGGGQLTVTDELQEGWHFHALLHKVDGSWKVEGSGIGVIDGFWEGIDELHPSAPKQIFPWRDAK